MYTSDVVYLTTYYWLIVSHVILGYLTITSKTYMVSSLYVYISQRSNKMASFERGSQPPIYVEQTGYQLSSYRAGQVPLQQRQHLAQPPEDHINSQTPRNKEDDELSDKGEGEPGYIPDRALNVRKNTLVRLPN